jgi:hypothetical protein
MQQESMRGQKNEEGFVARQTTQVEMPMEDGDDDYETYSYEHGMMVSHSSEHTKLFQTGLQHQDQ